MVVATGGEAVQLVAAAAAGQGGRGDLARAVAAAKAVVQVEAAVVVRAMVEAARATAEAVRVLAT